jgi:hypothetical protein
MDNSEIKEKLIIKFKLPLLNNLSLINVIVSHGYRQTGNKFTVYFNGSRGYLSNVEISCEGYQKERNNVIWVEDLRLKSGKLRSKNVEVFHSDENGIRISI